ncbi:hypothetical protein [Streptomyces sp. 8N706]|uniref:hypothetical protein n=1 Tax=Streptomyces sp. 8N706 TaxID=3457416 RepID=UPI003FD23793
MPSNSTRALWALKGLEAHRPGDEPGATADERARRGVEAARVYAAATRSDETAAVNDQDAADAVFRDFITDLFHLAAEDDVTPDELLEAVEDQSPDAFGTDAPRRIVALLLDLREAASSFGLGWAYLTDHARSCHAEEVECGD